MARKITQPTRIEAHGQPPKVIEEFIGRVNSGTAALSVARMISPSGWSEPGQTPEFDEYTIVVRGALKVETRDEVHDVRAGEAIMQQAASGCATARLERKALSTSRSVCRRSRRRPCTAIRSSLPK